MGGSASTTERPAPQDRKVSTRSKMDDRIEADNERVSRLVQTMTAHPKKRQYGPLMSQGTGEEFDGYKV